MKKGVFRFSFLIAVVLAGIFAASCATSKKFTYLMNMQLDSAYVAAKAPETRFQVYDRLAVRVFCDEPELARPFNLTTGSDQQAHDASYLVENDGCIDFPVIGRVPVEGCTFKECENRIAGKIAEMGYIKPTGFRITPTGETILSVLGSAISFATLTAYIMVLLGR